MGGIRRWLDEWRPSAVTLGAPAFPLFVLLGLNAVDELDRSAFAVLLPDIRDHFGMSDAGALRLVAITTVLVLLIEVPLSFYADRGKRVRLATIGAAVWAVFSFGTGLMIGLGSLVGMMVMRVGAGTGRGVVIPTHNSLLADYYVPAARVKVFSAHRQANSVGMVLGPLVGGLVAVHLGLAWPFLLFAVPTLVFVVLALRLKEPIRGYHDRVAAGVDPDAPYEPDPPESVRSTMRVLSQVRTIRRIWFAAPCLGILLFGVPNLLALVYEDVFGLDAGARGLISAGAEPLQIVGVFAAMPFVARKAMEDPPFLLRFVSIVGVVDGILLVVLANAPHVSVAIAMHLLLAASIGTLVPAFFAMLSIVAPARVRAASFSTISVFAAPGIALFLPLIGQVSDRFGIRAAILVLVPMAVTAGFILSSAAKFLVEDILKAHAPPPTPEELDPQLTTGA